MKLIEKSCSGVYRLPLFRGWAVGFWPGRDVAWTTFYRYYSGGWELSILWFYIGRRDRNRWTHWKDSNAQEQNPSR